jgi:hypothetical protein
MKSVLISGDTRLIDDVAAALGKPDIAVTRADRLEDLAEVCAQSGPAYFDAYVQLPASFTMSGPTAIDRVHHFYAYGVLARFDALRDVLPSLRPTSRVVFVLGQLPGEVATEDDRNARQALVRVLAHAATADFKEGRITTSIQESGVAALDIADIALGTNREHDALLSRFAGLDYNDRRVELIGLVGAKG